MKVKVLVLVKGSQPKQPLTVKTVVDSVSMPQGGGGVMVMFGREVVRFPAMVIVVAVVIVSVIKAKDSVRMPEQPGSLKNDGKVCVDVELVLNAVNDNPAEALATGSLNDDADGRLVVGIDVSIVDDVVEEFSHWGDEAIDDGCDRRTGATTR